MQFASTATADTVARIMLGEAMSGEEPLPTKVTIGPKISAEDATRLWRIYESISKNIERENTLIGLRISWSIFLSAGIVGAQTFIANYVGDRYRNNIDVELMAQSGVVVLSLVAALFCFCSGLGVRAAQKQMDHIKEWHRKKKKEFIELGYPRPYGDTDRHRIGNYNALVFPASLLALWLLYIPFQSYHWLNLAQTRAEERYKASLKSPLSTPAEPATPKPQ